MEHKVWSIRLEQLPTKDLKMFEKEAEELLKKYEEDLIIADKTCEDAAYYMYLYSTRWNEAYKACHELKIKISALKMKMEAAKEDNNE